MGDEGTELLPQTLEKATITVLGEAETEALLKDTAFCELLPLWASLSEEAKQIILTIAKSRSS